MTKQIPLPVFTYENPDDDEERLEISMNGVVIASLNHDQHGWDGMQAVENAIKAIEEQMKQM
jgi:hypothetical protein